MSILQIEPGKARWKFDPKMWESKSTVAENKFDGSRYLMQVGIDKSRFTSRHISKKTNLFVEKSDNIPHLRDLFAQMGVDSTLDGCVFDGEIVYRDNIRSKSMDVTKIMGSLPSRAVELQNDGGWLDYYIFDILYNAEGKDIRHLPYQERRAILLGYLEDVADPKRHLNITPIETENKEKFYLDIIEAGGEGVILKDVNAPYGKNWAKVKRHATIDAVIMGFEAPTEITKKVSGEESTSHYFDKGWIGSIIFGQYFGGKLIEFGRTSGIDESLREELSLHGDKYIGSVIEVECQERITKTGKLRHPRFLRFRPDKNAEQCVYRPGET